jgi:hypothetical protein
MVRTVEITEKRAAESFKISNLEAIVDQLTAEKMQKLAYIVTYGALVNLNEYVADHPLKAGNEAAGEWEFKYINDSIYSLVLKGTATGSNFVDGVEMNIGEENSLKGWATKFNKSLSKIGLVLSRFSMKEFSINQTDYKTINYSFVLNITVEARDGSASLTRAYRLNGSIDITGLIDPAILREGKKKSHDLTIEKQFFFNEEYKNPSSLKPERLEKEGSAGQGWFYGPLVEVKNAIAVAPQNRSKWILVGSYDDITNLRCSSGDNCVDYTQFGAYIFNETTQAAIQIKKPFAVVEGFKIGDLPRSTSCPEGKCVLFNAREGDDTTKKVLLYGIEPLRDFAICGYYVNNNKAPSYFQRFFNDTYSRNSTLGIETFLIGDFIGGKGTNEYGQQIISYWDNDYSRLDRELFNEKKGERIRGMPGCKNKEMCSGDSPVGQFRLGEDAMKDYGANDISCANGMASCG